MLAATTNAHRLADLQLHTFEPDTRAFATLTRVLDGAPANLSKTALSDRVGNSPFHVIAPAAGTNSLHAMPDTDHATLENVATTTLELYAERSGVSRFALVKIDTEGHDLTVMRGASSLFDQRRISIVQFEYNHRWVFARCYLRDAFELLLSYDYRIGKLTPRGVEFYPGWDADLETFVEGNYVACDPEVAVELPAVTWWKSR